jgi:chromosome segregation ATPase
MTTLGKILVFLVFIAALAMGGLMVFVSKTAPNWKTATDERDEHIKIIRAMREQEAASRQLLVQENEKLKQLLDSKVIDTNGLVARLKVEIADKEKQIQSAREQMSKSDLLAKQAQTEAARLQQELEYTQNTVKERETTIVKLQDTVTQANNAKQAAENNSATAAARLQSLYDQVNVKDRQLAELTKKNQPTATLASNNVVIYASYTNPPQSYVIGQIASVDDNDKTLVKITIGSDSGIRKDNTLEVYRLTPKGEYLGRLLIVDTDFHHAIGRLLRQPGLSAPPALRPGDEVATTIRP